MAGSPGRKNTPESRRRNGAELIACAVCGVENWVSRSRRANGEGKYCSRSCHAIGVSAALGGRSKVEGDTRHPAGYVLAWAPDHPRARHGRVLKHILVAEEKFGRRIERHEHVHHVNGIRDDNRPENLILLSPADHRRVHANDPAERARARERGKRNAQRRDRDAQGRFTS